MKKGLFMFLISFFLLFTNNAFAHTGLESSVPGNEEIVKEDLQKITLTFETKIEQGSTFTLTNSKNKEIQVQNIEKTDNQLIGILSVPLENENYNVQWQIIGVDGHIIDGEYNFTVDVPMTEEEDVKLEETPSDQTTKEDTTKNEGSQSQNDSELEVDHSTMSAEEHAAYEKANSDPSTVLIPAILILVGIVVIIIVAGFIITRKNKSK